MVRRAAVLQGRVAAAEGYLEAGAFLAAEQRASRLIHASSKRAAFVCHNNAAVVCCRGLGADVIER